MATPCSSARPRPVVLLNLAITSDGKIATANRRVVSFGSSRDRAHLYELRATADAVMCGARTVWEAGATLDAGPPDLRRARLRLGLTEELLRVVVSGSGKLPMTPRLLRGAGGPLIVLCSARAPASRRRRLAAQGVLVKSLGQHQVDLSRALVWLSEEFGVRRLLCEGGAELNAGLLRAGLVDEVHLTVCPWVFGGSGAPSMADGPIRRCLSQVLRGRLVRARTRGAEQFLVYAVSSARRARSQSKSEKRLRKTRISSLPS